jgi:hypothetical protein
LNPSSAKVESFLIYTTKTSLNQLLNLQMSLKMQLFAITLCIAMFHMVSGHRPLLEYLRTQAKNMERGLDSIIKGTGYSQGK